MSDTGFLQGDAIRLPFPDQSIDLVFGSPPYADARTYGIDAQRPCQEWIDWMLMVTTEAVRVSKGLVIWICAGVTRDWCYWPGPEGLLYEWWKRGGQCWRPAYWYRSGIPGSGGKHWLRADVEYALCFTRCKDHIPWSDNTACGHPPKWAPGGEMSHRLADGARVNQWGPVGSKRGFGSKRANGKINENTTRPSHKEAKVKKRGRTEDQQDYAPPVLANPGNLVSIPVGGGVLGDELAHDNEAPFPEKLCEFFLLSWCPPGGTVLDPFSGSGTTACVAHRLGRTGIGLDIRANQCELGLRRLARVQPELFV